MTHVSVVVIGGGQAGLAMSYCLSERGIDHVVLERGRLAERWRSERWESLRLLTPNWQSRLPGYRYEGPDPDGFMTMPEVVGFFEGYARSSRTPIEPGTEVLSVEPAGSRVIVVTSRGNWQARALVIATGHCDVPQVPKMAAGLAPSMHQLVPSQYRRAADLPEGGVLVVGASASGLQLADELRRAGREVTIAVGHHTRVPRRYRGRDIMWWLDRCGVLNATCDRVYDVDISRDQPSLQLVGSDDHHTLDLARLQRNGVQVVGRLRALNGTTARFDDDLVATTVAADAKLGGLLERIDACAAASGAADEDEDGGFEPLWPHFVEAPTSIDLAASGVTTVLWATGFSRRYPWLRLPILDGAGEIVHQGGITPRPGVYVLGLHFLRKRNSSFIDGVGDDAKVLAEHLANELRRGARQSSTGPIPAGDRLLAATRAS